MREIKFMAYIKHLKLLVDVDVVDFLEEEIEVTIEGDMHVYRFDEIELLQFTGLKDKNGEEIYEGDIVEGFYHVPFSSELRKAVCYVAWDRSGYWTYKGERDFTAGYLTDLKDQQVIGNIYENPDLLE